MAHNFWKHLTHSGGPILPKHWTFLTAIQWFVFSLVYTSPILLIYDGRFQQVFYIVTCLSFVPGFLLRMLTEEFNNKTNYLIKQIEKDLLPRRYGPGDRDKVVFIGLFDLVSYLLLNGKYQGWFIATIFLYSIILFKFSDYFELKKIILGNRIELLVETNKDWSIFHDWIKRVVQEKVSSLENYEITLSLRDRGVDWIALLNFIPISERIKISTKTVAESPNGAFYTHNHHGKIYSIWWDGKHIELFLDYSNISKGSINEALLALASFESVIENKESVYLIVEAGIISFPERTSVKSFPLHPWDVVCLGMIFFGVVSILRLIFHINIVSPLNYIDTTPYKI